MSALAKQSARLQSNERACKATYCGQPTAQRARQREGPEIKDQRPRTRDQGPAIKESRDQGLSKGRGARRGERRGGYRVRLRKGENFKAPLAGVKEA